MLDSVLGGGHTAFNKIDKIPCPERAYTLVKKANTINVFCSVFGANLCRKIKQGKEINQGVLEE